MPGIIALAWIGRFFASFIASDNASGEKKAGTRGEKAFSFLVYVLVLFPLACVLLAVGATGVLVLAWTFILCPILGWQ